MAHDSDMEHCESAIDRSNRPFRISYRATSIEDIRGNSTSFQCQLFCWWWIANFIGFWRYPDRLGSMWWYWLFRPDCMRVWLEVHDTEPILPRCGAPARRHVFAHPRACACAPRRACRALGTI